MVSKGKTRILVVDDEPRYVKAIQVNLTASGYEVLVAGDGQSAVEVAATENPDLIVLDVMMPGMSGFEACRQIRQFSTVPIIMLTAMAEEADKVEGLDAGADDYVTKPFGANEMLARVRAALRRGSLSEQSSLKPAFQAGDICVNFAQQRVFVRGDEVKLTATEYQLLCVLVNHVGQVLVPEHLLKAVWGSGYEGETRLIWQAIHRLRHKIEHDPKIPEYVQTRPGIGYIFVTPD